MFGSLPGLEWLRAVKLYTILRGRRLPVPDADRARLCSLRHLPQLPRCQLGCQASGLPDQGPALRHAARHGRLAVHRLAGQRHARVLPGHRRWRQPGRYRGTSLFAGIVSVWFWPRSSTPASTPFLSRLRKRPRTSTGTSSARSSPRPCWPLAASTWSASARSGTILDWHEFVKSPVPAPASRASTCFCTWPCSSSPRLDP